MTEDEERGEIVTVDDSPLAPMTTAGEVKQLYELAINKGIDVEGLEKLLALHEHVADRHARTEFAEALARFQAACPPVPKTSTAKFTSKKSGIAMSYNYAKLETIARHIGPHLVGEGLSYTFDSKVTESGLLEATCTLRHTNGHSQTASFACPTTSQTPAMSDQQRFAGALQFARRQTLIQVLGLSTTEPDNDGAEYQPITEDQAKQLEALIVEVGADRKRFLDFLQVDTMESIPIADFEMAVRELRRKGLRG